MQEQILNNFMPWDHTFHSCLSSLTSDDTCFFFLSITLFTCGTATPPFIYWFLHNQFSLPPCLLYITCCGGTLDSLFLSRTQTHISSSEICGDLTMSLDQELCYLCKEDLRDPVSIPCGHIFCSVCINTYWDHADHTGQYLCPQCRVAYNKRPNPRRFQSSRSSSSSLRNRDSDSFPPAPPAPDYNYAGPQDVGCDICIGKKLKAVKSCLMCLASYCEKHLKPHYESSTFKRHKLVDEIGHLDRQICPQHQKGLELYCRTDQMCICVLCTVKEHKGHDMVSAEQERAEMQVRFHHMQNKSAIVILVLPLEILCWWSCYENRLIGDNHWSRYQR